jgi:hypothetical protein
MTLVSLQAVPKFPYLFISRFFYNAVSVVEAVL